MLKLAIQFRTKEYAKKQAFQRSRTISVLQMEVSKVSDEIALQPADAWLHLRGARLDQILAEYYGDIHEVARLKAGMKYKTQGERPTKYFTSLMRQRYEKSQITSLKISRDGAPIVIDPIEEILEEASRFYAELYSRQVTVEGQEAAACF
jgi:hypothetical protein